MVTGLFVSTIKGAIVNGLLWVVCGIAKEIHDKYFGGTPEFGDILADALGGKRKGKRGRGAEGKTIVFGMLEKDGDVMTKVVPNVKAKTLKPLIHENVEKGTEIQSDELRSYQGLDMQGYGHNTVNHSKEQYVDGDTHVNSIEGYWSRLKNSIKGTHVHVSGKHLGKYAKEFEYRYNSRKNPGKMFPELLSSFDK